MYIDIRNESKGDRRDRIDLIPNGWRCLRAICRSTQAPYMHTWGPNPGLLHHLRDVVPLLLERFVFFVDLMPSLAMLGHDLVMDLLWPIAS